MPDSGTTGIVPEETQETTCRGLRCNDDTSEGTKAMSKFDDAPEEAEADLRRASDALSDAEDELAVAEERADEIEQEPFDGSPEAEADISQRMEIVQREIESLSQDVASADWHMCNTLDFWGTPST